MFEQMFMPWVIFISLMYMVFVIVFMDTSEGNNMQRTMWKVVPLMLMFALGIAWFLEMGFVLPPQ